MPHSSGRRFWIRHTRMHADFVKISWPGSCKYSRVATRVGLEHLPNSVLCCLLLWFGLYILRQSLMSTLGAVAHRPTKMSSVDAGPGLGSTPAISNRASWHRGLTAAPAAVAESGVVAVTLAVCWVVVWLVAWPVVLLGTWHSRVNRRNSSIKAWSFHGPVSCQSCSDSACSVLFVFISLQGVGVLVLFQQPKSLWLPCIVPLIFPWCFRVQRVNAQVSCWSQSCMWGKIMILMYRLWWHGLYGLYGPRCLLSPEMPLDFIAKRHGRSVLRN